MHSGSIKAPQFIKGVSRRCRPHWENRKQHTATYWMKKNHKLNNHYKNTKKLKSKLMQLNFVKCFGGFGFNTLVSLFGPLKHNQQCIYLKKDNNTSIYFDKIPNITNWTEAPNHDLTGVPLSWPPCVYFIF